MIFMMTEGGAQYPAGDIAMVELGEARWRQQCGAVLPSRTGHGGGRSELFKLDCSEDLWFLLIVVMTFGFLGFLSGIFVVAEESFGSLNWSGDHWFPSVFF